MRALVTGSSGFIGRALMPRLPAARGLSLRGESWRDALGTADFAGAVVGHLAARVHEHGGDESRWIADNVDKTEALARAAARGGAVRLVFASTLKVHGEETIERPFSASDALRPGDAYARSKALAEERLAAVAAQTGLEVVVVRPPLVFGRGAKANLHRLMRLAASGWPLPFAAIDNRRSWIHVDDLCELLLRCAQHDAAAGRAFIATHADAFSTPRLVRGLRARRGHAARLFAAPRTALELAATVAGRGAAMRRLTRSLEADAGETTRLLGWQPAVSFERALDELAERGNAP
jgi:nucleoside-diphosphate-sugar epimerase